MFLVVIVVVVSIIKLDAPQIEDWGELSGDAAPRIVGKLASNSETEGAAMRSIAVNGADCQRQSVTTKTNYNKNLLLWLAA